MTGLLLDPANAGTGNGCILRRTYDLVRENHIDPLLKEFPFLREWYRVGDKEIRFPSGNVLAFRHAETSGDVDAMIGKQYRWFCVDQAEAFSEKELNVMKSCTRWPGLPGGASKFILTFNPGNIGHSFLKRIFYDHQYRANERESDYAFIQAYAWDNFEWARVPLREEGYADVCKDGLCNNCAACVFYSWDGDKRFNYFIEHTQYGRELNTLPQAMKIGWLLGRMDQFAGQYYDIFSVDRHVARVRPESWASRWLGIDWGYAHDSVCHWAAQLTDSLTGIYREFSAKGRSPKELAQGIVDRTPAGERERISHIYLSHDAFAQRTEQDTIALQMGEIFRANGMPWPVQATKDVLGRAALLYDLLGPPVPGTSPLEFREPGIVIDHSCTKVIDTIPMVCRDDKHPERPLKFDGDDAIDSLWYALTHRMGTAQAPYEVRLAQEAEKITDPTARWFYVQKMRKQHAHHHDAVIRPLLKMGWERTGS